VSDTDLAVVRRRRSHVHSQWRPPPCRPHFTVVPGGRPENECLRRRMLEDPREVLGGESPRAERLSLGAESYYLLQIRATIPCRGGLLSLE
jgi:hypothetical protein